MSVYIVLQKKSKSPRKMFSSNLYNYGFSYTENSINKAPLTLLCLPTAELSDGKQHFSQGHPLKLWFYHASVA